MPVCSNGFPETGVREKTFRFNRHPGFGTRMYFMSLDPNLLLSAGHFSDQGAANETSLVASRKTPQVGSDDAFGKAGAF